jgi:sugar/nucleoside kinase (ribokinase family)
MVRSPGGILDSRQRGFDVICAGEAMWNLVTHGDAPPRLEIEGGAVRVARALVRQELRVGLATVLPDDMLGRELKTQLGERGLDVGGVQLAVPRSDLVVVKGGGARQVVSTREEDPPMAVPDGWVSQVLLLSGMSPVVSHAAALCKAARAARRAGSLVVLDVNVRWHLWKGRDPRAIHSVLREAHVVSCSAQDLFGLNLDGTALRAALRPHAVLVYADGAGRVTATGPFGEVGIRSTAEQAPLGSGTAIAVAICRELARATHADEKGGDVWARMLERSQRLRNL